MHDLTPGQRAQLEALMVTREHALERELHQLAEQLGAGSDERSELAALALSDDPEAAREHPEERGLLLARLDLLRQQQAALGEALLALRSGRYGRCMGCGLDLPFDRLKVRPEAQRCIDCARAAEA
jgi:DnaK suppressor protein